MLSSVCGCFDMVESFDDGVPVGLHEAGPQPFGHRDSNSIANQGPSFCLHCTKYILKFVYASHKEHA